MARLFRYDRTDSTNERAFDAIAAGTARDGDVHVAHEQSAGRGRLGRHWESAPGEGLYLSYVHLLQPTGNPIPPPAITMAVGLAVLDAVRRLGLAKVRLDWPNDLVVGSAKLAGILVESRGFDPTAPHFVIGIGVNVAQTAFSEELRCERAVTSLALEGIPTTPDELLARLLPHISDRLCQAESERDRLAKDYLAGTRLGGTRVTVEGNQRTLTGTLLGLDLARGLRIDTDGGMCTIDLAHVRGLIRASS